MDTSNEAKWAEIPSSVRSHWMWWPVAFSVAVLCPHDTHCDCVLSEALRAVVRAPLSVFSLPSFLWPLLHSVLVRLHLGTVTAVAVIGLPRWSMDQGIRVACQQETIFLPDDVQTVTTCCLRTRWVVYLGKFEVGLDSCPSISVSTNDAFSERNPHVPGNKAETRMTTSARRE